ncbi:MAG: hypothetical protein AAGD25_11265 [Cyanobacteria bacterium P01_F01_bin.150]
MPFKDDQGANYSLIRLSEFPTSIECWQQDSKLIGLILLKQPPDYFPDADWRVGIDFNPSFTNIAVGCGGKVDLLALAQDLHLKVTKSPLNKGFPALIKYFLPERFLPAEEPLPLHSILTTRASPWGIIK